MRTSASRGKVEHSPSFKGCGPKTIFGDDT